ncbi:MAG: hypothetical protein EOP56_19235 [Sphingobacteriales bacterium]|nr:MAG: hypothetical protein EOP56_19235 [Sphingobacteriales bacterium]
MPFNIVDFILILIIVLAAWAGYSRGFILGFLTLIGWLGSLILSFLAYPYVLRLVDKNAVNQSAWLIPLVFLGIFMVIRLITGWIINRVLESIAPGIHSNGVNRVFGLIPGALNGLIYAAVTATILLIFPFSQPFANMARESVLANRFSEPVSRAEEKITPVFEDALKRTMGKMTIDPESDKFVKLHYTVEDPRPRPDLEARMLILVNEERVKHGLKPVLPDPEMRVVARKHSADMFARGYFSHNTPEGKNPFDRMRAGKVRFLTAGENLALARNLMMAHQGLMNSPGHRANILRPAFGRLGIGVLDGGIYGIMVTQNFRN